MEMDREGVEQVFQQLLEQSRLQQDDVTARLSQAVTPRYWQELCPHLSMGGLREPATMETPAADSRRLDDLVERFATEGYFHSESMLSQSTVGRMSECIETLRRNDWPPVFAFVYDEFWLATMAPSLVQVLTAILGPDYKRAFNIWAYYVNPRKGARGWPPHVDGDPRGKQVTVWISLTDATLDNGCMYLIPRHLIPEGVGDSFGKLATISFPDVAALLQSSRALPARAGSVLCWDYRTVHWGSTCDQPGGPRISIGFSFLSADARPKRVERPLVDGRSALPTFAERLQMIGKGVLTYEFREPRLVRYIELAKRLIEQVHQDPEK